MDTWCFEGLRPSKHHVSLQTLQFCLLFMNGLRPFINSRLMFYKWTHSVMKGICSSKHHVSLQTLQFCLLFMNGLRSFINDRLMFFI